MSTFPYEYTPDADEWAQVYRDLGYAWCRPCREWHRPPECWVDANGVAALDQTPD